MKLEEIITGCLIQGIFPGKIAKIIGVEQLSPDIITIYYKLDDGIPKERQLFRRDEDKYSLAIEGRHFAFDANADDFKLAMEAQRIANSHLFDPYMAVHSSNIIPLPHQITAVYESMLPKQPLRYVLADDPGAGKTIMAGLLIRELIARSDIERILIVCPGVLVEQWQDELDEKFNLKFRILSNEMNEQCRGNVFEEHNCLIARLDQLKQNEDFLEKLELVNWDLVIVDEAHKMSASQNGSDVKKTQRFRLGELLSSHTKHFLLMTATPHNGKEEDFQLFLSLLDKDRFYAKIRGAAERADVSDVMRRMCKEDLLKFDGTRLFPERKAVTASYELSDLEMELYEDVTLYVREEMNKAERLDKNKRVNVGFALTSLQRRLASSPEAIHKSLENRKKKLIEKQKDWEEGKESRGYVSDVMAGYTKSDYSKFEDDLFDDLTGHEYEERIDQITDNSTAARSLEELKNEIKTLEGLEEKAHQLVLSEKDRKWDELSRLLQNTPEMRGEDGKQRKLIIFTEYKATLNYLQDRITDLLGSNEEVVVIHGGVKRESRREIQEKFRNVPDVRILIATDAAGEGVNLQTAHLMINYDLPWNPNRIEQRFGRIHRIGQTEVCYLWNLIAKDTREGDVFATLFAKLEVERQALGGKVFDVLGDLFEDRSLADLLLEAIRYGEDPKTKARLKEKVEGALDRKHIEDLIRRNALTQDIMSPERVFAVREEMEKAEARKLQPYFVRSYFLNAFSKVGGVLNQRETGRYEISHVPSSILERDHILIDSERRDRNPVVHKYDRVCFDKEDIEGKNKQAVMLHPGHPLMRAVTSIILEKYGGLLKQGAVFVDPLDNGHTPSILYVLDHRITESNDLSKVISRRFQFVKMNELGEAMDAGFAPHLDLRSLTLEEERFIEENCGEDWRSGADRDNVLDGYSMSWIGDDVERKALSYANTELVPHHFDEIRRKREEDIDKTKCAIRERLSKEIDYLTKQRMRFEADVRRGKGGSIQNLEKVKSKIERLRDRLKVREADLDSQRDVVSQTPLVIGACIVLPFGLFEFLSNGGQPYFTPDFDCRSEIEMKGMQAVFAKERSMGYETTDVSKENCGWDITSRKKDGSGMIIDERHIEVKGKGMDSPVVTVSKNEIMYGLNQREKFILAIVRVDGDVVMQPRYIHEPFTKEPAFDVVSQNFDVEELLARSKEF